MGCGSNSTSSSEAANSNVSGRRVVVVMEEGSFKTESITLPDGKERPNEIVNEGSVPHDFAIESLDLNAGTVEPGETIVTTVVATKGANEFVCTFHPGMKGRIATCYKSARCGQCCMGKA